MSLHTPRRTGGNVLTAASSPSLNIAASTFSASTSAIGRKASVNAVGAASDWTVAVNDTVDVPGGMCGIVRFIGPVAGKTGVFAGVELSGKFATLGKNNGCANGTRYFEPEVPGSGIFLPIHRAVKRQPEPFTPTTPTGAVNYSHPARVAIPPIPPQPPHHPHPSAKLFSQSVGPGTRPGHGHVARPSLGRLSPGRKALGGPGSTPKPARQVVRAALSRSQIGGRPGLAPSPAPPRGSKPRPSDSGRPFSRTGSRAGGREEPIGRPGSRARGVASQTETTTLRHVVAERDQQLRTQAMKLNELETTLAEMKIVMNGGNGALEAMLREKNETISRLTVEFDTHRADLQQTVDSVEAASAEAERVYEDRVRALERDVASVRAGNDGDAQIEFVQQQVRNLEAVVAELEDGVEQARRGEAEARTEVEFLRGEIERSRTELRRERDKAAAASGSGPGSDTDRLHGQIELLGREKAELQISLNLRDRREDELEAEVARLQALVSRIAGSNQSSEPDSRHGSRVKLTTTKPEPNSVSDSAVWCDLCETTDHDILDCTAVGRSPTEVNPLDDQEPMSAKDEPPLSARLHGLGSGVVAGQSGGPNPDQWCAMCESDGHLMTDCPYGDTLLNR